MEMVIAILSSIIFMQAGTITSLLLGYVRLGKWLFGVGFLIFVAAGCIWGPEPDPFYEDYWGPLRHF